MLTRSLRGVDYVDYVFHLATPSGVDALSADYANPAVQGTKSILHAAMSFPVHRRMRSRGSTRTRRLGTV
ncbi:uncharacterized protein N7482_004084 [Penicillium canariense]|uniref:Uncharacterized protein n=1 Tax=Penicillium canariense TaxID=189055 RepID=A0A9W9LPX8_9EURO|nr:uncharacterized protein N7482_004084 [Penicillium canariense]KAJ5168490.1 hypothetical protein N7482_004084 [Penicillium canariense]